LEKLIDILIEQAPLIVFMGAAIWWLVLRLVKVEEAKDGLTERVVKLTTLWEEKANQLGNDDKEFQKEAIKILTEIKAICSKS